jgi:hypothetical protein
VANFVVLTYPYWLPVIRATFTILFVSEDALGPKAVGILSLVDLAEIG